MLFLLFIYTYEAFNWDCLGKKAAKTLLSALKNIRKFISCFPSASIFMPIEARSGICFKTGRAYQ